MRIKRERQWRFLIKFHTAVTAVVFGTYFALGFFTSPSFLWSDIQEKLRVFADDTITVTAMVPGPPQKPVVTAAAVCDDGDLYVTLNWADDSGSTSFDIMRDGGTLVTGLTASSYQDNSVIIGTTYTYIVTANGPMSPGSSISDPVPVTTPSKCEAEEEAPVVTIVTFGPIDVTDYDKTPKTDNRRPLFTGTSNIPNANIHITISSSLEVIADIVANANGYWSFQPSVKLSRGRHTITVTATDPLDPTRRATDTLVFRITSGDDDDNSGKKEESVAIEPEQPVVSESEDEEKEWPAVSTEVPPFALRLQVENRDAQVFQGRELLVRLNVDKLQEQYRGQKVTARFVISDVERNPVLFASQDIALSEKYPEYSHIDIPLHWKPGPYTVQAEVLLGKFDISSERPFTVVALPILNVGGNMVVTYPQLVSNMGWLSLALLFLLFFILLLEAREGWLYAHSTIHITGKQLERASVISHKRKGVSR